MTKYKSFLCSILTIGALFIADAAPHAAYAAETCDASGNLSYDDALDAVKTGIISVGFAPDFGGNKVTATVTNHTSCSVAVSLGTFKMFGEWSAATQSQQEFFSDTPVQTVAPDASASFSANAPSCAYQYDVWYGAAPHALVDNQVYGSFLAGNPAGNTPYCTHAPADQPPIGWLDAARCDLMGGWSYDPDDPASSIDVRLYDGTTALGTVHADGDRPDVRDVMKVTGNHGFNLLTSAALKDGRDHVIHAFGLNKQNGAETELSGSPKTLHCDAPVTTTTTPPTTTPTNNSTTTVETTVTSNNSTTTVNVSTTTTNITNNYNTTTTSTPGPVYYPSPQIVYAPNPPVYVPVPTPTAPVLTYSPTPVYTPPAPVPAPVIYPGAPNTGFGPDDGPRNVMLYAIPLCLAILAGICCLPFAKHELA
jgi:hypothetical protein